MERLRPFEPIKIKKVLPKEVQLLLRKRERRITKNGKRTTNK